MPTKPFKGIINVDVRDSKPDWAPFLPSKAPENAPNILYVVLDDVGIAALSCYGNPVIETPNFDRIANWGLRFTNWHTTALCSPTRSCLLTGRNAHRNGMACITEGANGFPGISGVIPPENGMISEILKNQGWAIYALGKWHLTPAGEETVASSRRTWPLGRGFERFYGFLGAETNQWYPDLVYDNHPTEQPNNPEEGYHLSKDLTDKAISFISDLKQINPDKPWFVYLAYGATHAPHHAPKEWIDKYKGKFDMGYEKFREITLERMKTLKIVPNNTELAPLNPWPAPEVIVAGDLVRPWDSLQADEKNLFCRMAEVYAGFLSYTDHQLGHLLDYLEETKQVENTIIVVVSDNGASGEGSPNGSVNENKFFNGWPDDLQDNLKYLDTLGSPDTYNHYPTGWALAFNTPYKMFKRYSLEGGIADPCLISWMKNMKSVAGQIRDQYHHATDIVPTLLDLCNVQPPSTINGIVQSYFDGISMAYTFNEANAKSLRTTQYYAMLGTRAIYHDGWKVVSKHGPISGKGHFNDDEWELYHISEDRAEIHNLAQKYPEKVRELVCLWFAEAGRNQVFPLDDRTAMEILLTERPTEITPQNRYIYYPGSSPVPESVAVNLRGRSYVIGAALKNITKEAQGIIFGQGSRFGGHVLFIKDGKAIYIYNFLGMEQQRFESNKPLPTGDMRIGVVFTKTGTAPHNASSGKLQLAINGDVVAEGPMRTQPGFFGLAGSGLTVGRNYSDPISDDYKPPFEFKGGVIKFVAFDVSDKPLRDLQLEFKAALARD
jgi:arylsulfatase A-like enzyme